ncbi:VapE domain-containing protein [Bacteroides sp. 214]|uniref:VapE domain-containing protein n=1 Tax=Bacteroides sp. 214 TaxID=2302935 RepID=UPI001EF1ED3F|nr:VapE domain-containing protein [Bacteroides sp. 214]
MQKYLAKTYEFRFNKLTDENEFRRRTDEDFQNTKQQENLRPFIPLNTRETNSICMELHEKGINCWDRDLSRYLNSTFIESYHPFLQYLENLPVWDGEDRVTSLAQRVSTNALWVRCFHTWMLGMVNQWRGTANQHANSLAPILISAEQGKQKSTFCKSLIPPALQHYYIDHVELTSQGQMDRKLSELGLINLDEFDKFSPKKMALLKNVMQMTALHIRMPHQKVFQTVPRLSSFIGTSNRRDLLTDPTGSRRFICIEVRDTIACTNIDHAQIYAQLMAELNAGKPHWLNSLEERELQKHNKAYYRESPMRDVLYACFRPAKQDEECLQLTAAEIFRTLKIKNSAAMVGSNPVAFGQLLVASGLERKHTKRGNVYRVVKVE